MRYILKIQAFLYYYDCENFFMIYNSTIFMPRINKSLRVPYALAVHDKEEEKRVLKVIREKRTILGKETYQFEKKVATLFGKKYGVMVNSGSSANLLAVALLDLPHGSEVITPILTFSTTVAPLVLHN